MILDARNAGSVAVYVLPVLWRSKIGKQRRSELRGAAESDTGSRERLRELAIAKAGFLVYNIQGLIHTKRRLV